VRQRRRLYIGGLIVLLVAWTVAFAGIGPYDITRLAALLTIAALLLVGFEISVYVRLAGRPSHELQLPLFVKRLVWRWPTTAGVISAEWLALSIAFGMLTATEGTWLLGLVALANALNALSVVLELRNPSSKWRNYGSEPMEGAWA
jgi:hypothetical protein